jgi:hypothetical protein
MKSIWGLCAGDFYMKSNGNIAFDLKIVPLRTDFML